jgi:Tfp pilus assembly protein PilN
MSAMKSKETRLVLGGVPRANLLPPEVGLAAKARSMRRGLSVLVVAAMVLVGVGYGLATLRAAAAQGALDDENARTASLLAEQAKYVEVRSVNNTLKLTTAARQVGASTEINWQAYLQSIQASLPAGTTVTDFTAASGSPWVAFQQPTVPLQGERIAELVFTATSPSLPDVQAWLNALKTLKGFVDASPGTVQLQEDDGTYEVKITMHISQEALSNRFAPEKPDAEPASTETDGGK